MKSTIINIIKGCLFLIVFIGIGLSSYAQVVNKVPFTLRTSPNSPAGSHENGIYNLRGDFTMIGNANLFDERQWSSGTPVENNSNNGRMAFYKLSGDPSNISNSSSASLVHPAGFSQTCSQIVFAGLYWFGRGNTTSVTLGNGLRKDRVQVKLPGQTAYTEHTANGIHIGGNDVDGMYTSFVDLTQQVRALGEDAWGTYAVGNIATTIGNGGATGYFGGWGMVVIYENASMKWRDITVFDGFSQIEHAGGNSPTYGELEVSGFRAAQNGAINVKMGMMAGEGDRGISGDVFGIQQRNTTAWTTLNHTGNTASNFFNSSIVTGGNPRVPNYTNNYGTDISMFDLPNGGNAIINNNQTSTKFRFGTTQDLYAIHSIVFAVDAYVPEVIGENGPATGSAPHQGLVDPGQELEFQLDLFNKGTEAVNGLTVDIPIPFNMHYVENGETIIPGSHSTIKIADNTTVQWIPPAHALSGATPDEYAGGTLRWNVGALPLDPNRNVLQGTLKYKFRVTDNCAFLTTAGSCGLDIKINGTITGTGATSGSTVSAQLVQAGGASACGDVIFDDFESTIVVSETFTANCQPPPIEDGMLQFVAFCSKPSNVFTRAEIADFYPKGTKFFTQEPTDYNTTAGLITGDFPVTLDGSKTNYWAMAPGMDPGCFMRLQTSVTLVTTVPVPTPQHATACYGEDVELNVTLSATGVSNGYQLFYFDNESSTTPLAAQPTPTAVGTHSFWVAEGVMQNEVLCIGPKVEITITIYPVPTAAQDVADVSICENNDIQVTVTTSGATSYVWEYTTVAAPTVWLTLDNSTFSGQVTLTNNTMHVSHAMRVGANSIDGIKVRLKAINDSGCEAYSNEIAVEVKDCRAITNPMLPNKANSN